MWPVPSAVLYANLSQNRPRDPIQASHIWPNQSACDSKALSVVKEQLLCAPSQQLSPLGVGQSVALLCSLTHTTLAARPG